MIMLKLLAKSSLFVPIALILVVMVGLLEGCTKREPIRIGFAAQLTGNQSDIGIQWRNGAQLAVNQINASGGVDGRPLELVIRDDKGTPEGVRAVDHELIKSGVVAIIGHGTSALTKVALPTVNSAHIVLISPGASAPELTKKGGYFFRVNSGLKERISDYSRYIYQSRGIKTIAIIYDTDNASLSLPYFELFNSKYKRLGGKVVDSVAFSSAKRPKFVPLIKRLQVSNAEGLLIIAGSNDTALIAQRTRQIGWDVPQFSSFWADLDVIQKFGGKAVEGLTIELNFDPNSKSPEFQRFVKQYKAIYGTKHIDTSAFGYETVEILATALKKTGGKAAGLRQALLETKNFKGLAYNFHFDKQGGAVRPSYVGIVQNGKTEIIKIGTPEVTVGKP